MLWNLANVSKFFTIPRTSKVWKVCPVCESRSWKKGHCTECVRLDHIRGSINLRLMCFLEKKEELWAGIGWRKGLIVFLLYGLLAHLVSSLTGVSSEMIVLDETFAMLDDENHSKLLNLCVERLPTLGIKQILVISHHDDVTTSIPSILRVDKGRWC